MARHDSSPMAPAFMVSAPGKVILFGEHAAVHGKPAIAAAISLRSYLLVTTLSKSRRTVTLNFRDIGLHHTWPIDALPWSAFRHPSKKTTYSSPVHALDTELLNAVSTHAEAVSSGLPEKQRKMHVRSATAFLYLFLSLGSPQSPGFVYTLRSTIPIGAGLGSSASICVCLSAALLLQVRILSGPHPDQPADEAKKQIERVNHWAYVGELCIHGDPSGVDNTVSSHGGAVLFQRDCTRNVYTAVNTPSTVVPISSFPKLRLLLVDTRQPRTTAALVGKVQQRKNENPVTIGLVLDAIGKLTDTALTLLSSADFAGDNQNDTLAIDRLGELMRINHALLDALGVSHPRLERARQLADAEVGWTKLTGAGGGGCAITLVRPGVEEAAVEALGHRFAGEGFQKYETILGADGVGVLWPAMFRNGPFGELGEEIDQSKFENADGAHGIEQLVGVDVRDDSEGWRFWGQ